MDHRAESNQVQVISNRREIRLYYILKYFGIVRVSMPSSADYFQSILLGGRKRVAFP